MFFLKFSFPTPLLPKKSLFDFFPLFLLLFFVQEDLSSLSLKKDLSAEAVYLINPENGCVLYKKNEDLALHPASCMKVATALFIIEKYPHLLEEYLVADKESLERVTETKKLQQNYPSYTLETDASHIGIQSGEVFKVKDLLSAILVVSACDASNVVAKYIGKGSIPLFMDGLNAYVKNLSCENTFLTNPHGLKDEKQKSTARDLAKILAEAHKNSLFEALCSQKEFIRPVTNFSKQAQISKNTNRLTRPGKLFYSPVVWAKTGYHSKAGHCLAGVAQKESRTLIFVLLKEENRLKMFEETKYLLEEAFNETSERRVIVEKNQPFKTTLPETKKQMTLAAAEPIEIEYYPSEIQNLHLKINIQENTSFNKNTTVGKLQAVLPNGFVIREVALVVLEEPTADTSLFTYLLWGAAFFVVIGGIYLYKKGV